jgi:hypothetical protein
MVEEQKTIDWRTRTMEMLGVFGEFIINVGLLGIGAAVVYFVSMQWA